MGHDGDYIQGLVTVYGVRCLLERVEDPSDALLAGKDIRIAIVDDLPEAIGTNRIQVLVAEERVSSTDERTGTAVSEELPLESIYRDNSDRRGAGEVIKELFELA